MNHGRHRRCTSTRDGQDLLMVLVTGATTQETTVTDMSATSRTGGPQDRKIGQSRMSNQTIRFPREQQQLLVSSTSKGR
jgi:hypothetical protein